MYLPPALCILLGHTKERGHAGEGPGLQSGYDRRAVRGLQPWWSIRGHSAASLLFRGSVFAPESMLRLWRHTFGSPWALSRRVDLPRPPLRSTQVIYPPLLPLLSLFAQPHLSLPTEQHTRAAHLHPRLSTHIMPSSQKRQDMGRRKPVPRLSPQTSATSHTPPRTVPKLSLTIINKDMPPVRLLHITVPAVYNATAYIYSRHTATDGVARGSRRDGEAKAAPSGLPRPAIPTAEG